ncbi:hypothetical protein GCM10017056_27440 [Seohaeicola zhoushanensis]|uniref:Serine protease n=2 Tax=Seohaeicola zhoushanensis TaxID=1569283 RepID=A0A8J3GZ04_9RHOB|nr:hypothetical protein GCM10017056_27440 [Seohaeicola zhoushanensis]
MTKKQSESVHVHDNGLPALPYLVIRIDGESRGVKSSGTGFFYMFENGERQIPTVITNKHVVDGLDALTFHFALSDSQGRRLLQASEPVTIETKSYKIIRHPNPSVDLVAIPILPMYKEIEKRGKEPFRLTLDKSHLPADWLRKRLVASTSALMVGFPNGLMDIANNLPLTRRGILATPYVANYEGLPNFVVDIAAFAGSSGSPVFALFESGVPTSDGAISIGESEPLLTLIGVLHSGPTITAEGEIIPEPAPVSKNVVETRFMMHLGYCLRAELIEDLGLILASAMQRVRT